MHSSCLHNAHHHNRVLIIIIIGSSISFIIIIFIIIFNNIMLTYIIVIINIIMTSLPLMSSVAVLMSGSVNLIQTLCLSKQIMGIVLNENEDDAMTITSARASLRIVSSSRVLDTMLQSASAKRGRYCCRASAAA